jgi:hypothetical protein
VPTLWTRSGVTHLPCDECTPSAASAHARVVVGRVLGGRASPADADFIWDGQHGVRQLRTLLAKYEVTIPEGWRVHSISDISNDARVVVGLLESTGPSPTAIQDFRATLPAGAFD